MGGLVPAGRSHGRPATHPTEGYPLRLLFRYRRPCDPTSPVPPRTSHLRHLAGDASGQHAHRQRGGGRAEGEVRRALPLTSREQVTQFEMQARADGGQPNTRALTEEHLRLSARDKRTSVTYAPSSITIETTKYETWDDLRALAETGLAARMDVAPVDGVERIGLRYVDEVRIPGDERPDWRSWIEPQLAPPALEVAAGALVVQQQQSVVQYATERAGVSVVLRYGAVDGPSVIQAIPLVRPEAPSSSPFFLVDTDASWTPGPGAEVPPLDPGSVLAEADVLHSYVKELFEASLTDQLRSEVLDAE